MIARYIAIGSGFVILAMGIWVMSLRADLANCRNANIAASLAANELATKSREEGRTAALADGLRLRAEEAERREMLLNTIKGLEGITKRLNAPRPPIVVTATSEPPVVVTPPVASCALDRSALDDLTAFLNRGRP